ncbi:MAG: purine-nucleoside phosphorylase [Chitinophagales bacterium]|nr:purine-nucleoside phosphorylase [Chitinophagales bacterium]MDW8418654.1 purine-nucleoside phosphorylase [Chitinophagales bacterium]
MENLFTRIEETATFLRSKINSQYEYGIILGTGLGNLVNQIDVHLQISYRDIPNFPQVTVVGHKGQLIFGKLGGKNVMAMSGRFHYYEGYTMYEITFPIRVMKALGIHTLIVSNASGGMNPEFEVGDIMIITDHIYLHPEHPLRGKNDDRLGPRFPNMNHVYDEELIRKALSVAVDNNIRCHTGVYVGVQGPTFETPAEYRMFHRMGGDAVGMSTTPEVVVARHCGMRVFALSVISDMGYPPEKADDATHEFVLQKAKAAEPHMTKIVTGLLEQL